MDVNNMDDCLKAGMLKKYSHNIDEILAEMRQSEDDLASARESLRSCNYKWATVQAYYSMFHAAKAVLYSAGYRERSHYAYCYFWKNWWMTEDLSLTLRTILGRQCSFVRKLITTLHILGKALWIRPITPLNLL